MNPSSVSRRHPRSRSRSRSPHKHSRKSARSRSRSPYQSPHHHSHRSSHNKRKHHDTSKIAAALPFGARHLSKHDLKLYEPVLALYLDIQKNILLENLSTEEIKGRWKSFMGKWNRGDVAEGWYDPKMLEKALKNQDQGAPNQPPSPWPQSSHRNHDRVTRKNASASASATAIATAATAAETPSEPSSESSDDFGPSIPLPSSPSSQHQPHTHDSHGPTIATAQDLQLQRETSHTTRLEARSLSRSQLKHDRHLERRRQAAALEDIAPRAQAGTRERQLEKRQEQAESNRQFANSRSEVADDVPDEEAFGGGDGVTELKKMREREERKKSERAMMREEELRARAAEREERMRGLREREERTIEGLRELARRRFGGGDEDGEGGV